MEGNDGNSTDPDAAVPQRDAELSGRVRVWIFAATMAVAIAAFGAVILFAVHVLGVPPGSLPASGTAPAMIVPVILLFNRHINPMQDYPFARRCFLLECLAILAATIASSIAAIWLLRPWLVEQPGFLARLGLGALVCLVVALAASAVQAIALRVCARTKIPAGRECR